jgi:hypothetical protein
MTFDAIGKIEMGLYPAAVSLSLQGLGIGDINPSQYESFVGFSVFFYLTVPQLQVKASSSRGCSYDILITFY